MAYIIDAETTFPENQYSQNEMMDFIKTVWPGHEEVLERLKQNAGVEKKNLILPLEEYKNLGHFEKRNSIALDKMLKTIKEALLNLQEKNLFDWSDVQIITSTTVTALAVPSLEARLMNQVPLPHNLLRLPLFGLGCLGGVASLNRTSDLLKAYPNKLAIVIASEACSLTFQFQDISMSNMVATSLFGDGSAVVLLAGEKHPLHKKSNLKIRSCMNQFYPDTERIMGWDILETGFKVVLSGDVAKIVHQHVGDNVETFLHQNHLKLSDIKNIISHPGGPKVLLALEETLKKDRSFFQHSWNSLREQGNMSSVSVLDVLKRHLKEKTLKKGPTLALAMGPGFNSELSLMEQME